MRPDDVSMQKPGRDAGRTQEPLVVGFNQRTCTSSACRAKPTDPAIFGKKWAEWREGKTNCLVTSPRSWLSL